MKEMKKLVWAIDVEGDKEMLEQAARALQPFLAAKNATVEPVFVLSPKTGIPAERLPQWEHSFREMAAVRVAGAVNRCELTGVASPTVLLVREPSIRSAAELLVAEAQSKGADLIVVSTHARHGISRACLGSFAETLLLQSTLPVLTVNPSAQAPTRLSRVLFPTDFGQPSRRGFEATVALCTQLGAKLCLYYKTPEPITAPFPEATVLYDYNADIQKQLQQTGKAWHQWAQNRGVETDFVFDQKPGNVAQSILELARTENVALISMVAQSGPISSVILGSTTRHVVRQAGCPVWIQHSKE